MGFNLGFKGLNVLQNQGRCTCMRIRGFVEKLEGGKKNLEDLYVDESAICTLSFKNIMSICLIFLSISLP